MCYQGQTGLEFVWIELKSLVDVELSSIIDFSFKILPPASLEILIVHRKTARDKPMAIHVNYSLAARF